MTTPRVSVVMSVYKEPVDWLRQSVDSILNQTFTDFEFIIICDNPGYKIGIAALKEYALRDSRIKLVFNESNIGLTKSLNKGLIQATGEYIARMDADDISMPTRFENQVTFLDAHKDCIVCGTRVKYIGNVKWWRRPNADWIKINDVENKGRLIIGSPFAHPTIMMRRLSPIQHYDENIRRSQDYDLWIRLSGKGQFYNLPQSLLFYRVSPTQISAASHNHFSQEIRRKYIRSIFAKYQIENLSEDYDLSPAFLLDKLDLIKNNKYLKKIEKKNLIQLVYFSQDNNRFEVFLKSVRSGDLFGFPFLDVVRYIMIVLGVRDTIEL